jgi:hypothetical protein
MIDFKGSQFEREIILLWGAMVRGVPDFVSPVRGNDERAWCRCGSFPLNRWVIK